MTMQTVEEAVEHYWQKKKAGEMDIGNIRQELSENPNYTADEVKVICQHISQLDIEHVREEQSSKPFLEHILLNYFFLFLWIAAIFVMLNVRNRLFSHVEDIPFWILISVSIVLAAKNLIFIVKKHLRG